MTNQRWQDWTIILLGVYLVLAPFLGIGVVTGAAAVNSYLIGTAVVVIALFATVRPEIWEEYINLAFGLWLIAAPFVLGFTNLVAPTWNQIIVGLLISAFSFNVILENSAKKAGHVVHKEHHGHT